ncbi:MAG TPA: OmpA family protein [Polyangiaceae bacterium]|nr:OmpA family protein [Polyangiaceae bacterium]
MSRRFVGSSLAVLALAVALFSSRAAHAQQKTLYLDRLTIGGAPDDGIAIWRPYQSPKTRFFAQMALGFTASPLRIRTVAPAPPRSYSKSPVSSQLIDYVSAGVEIGGRAAILATFPFALYQSGSDPTVAGVRGVGNLEPFAAMDMRLDFRGLVFRTDDRRWLFGAGISFFIPTGSQFNYGGDGATHTALNFSAETYVRDVIVAVNTGLHFRPTGVVGELAVGDEWLLGIGAYLPLRDGRVRVGGSLNLSTGIEKLAGQSRAASSTFFSARNTPLEWLAEGRMALDQKRQLWFGGGLGTRLDTGYGAPDLRVLAVIGYHLPIEDSEATAPERRMKQIRERLAREGTDADQDGIPDDIDLCPTDAEDKQDPDPTDGCPKPTDRDNDGIPDAADKCPDVAEDRDGIQDMDGCPDVDYDNDGVPDVSDACPREPGSPAPDPKVNGCPQFIKRIKGSTEIQILKQIQFDTGKATIKQSSYAIVDEIVKLLKANPDIKRLSIEGHTDNRGAVEMNNRLSQERADSVMKYLSTHGIDSGRLEAHGYGPSRPIESNDTEAGRQKNRRCEFHINQQTSSSGNNAPIDPGDAPRPTD